MCVWLESSVFLAADLFTSISAAEEELFRRYCSEDIVQKTWFRRYCSEDIVWKNCSKVVGTSLTDFPDFPCRTPRQSSQAVSANSGEAVVLDEEQDAV